MVRLSLLDLTVRPNELTQADDPSLSFLLRLLLLDLPSTRLSTSLTTHW